jgi:4-hydroxybenzoate polyprenyltransferase
MVYQTYTLVIGQPVNLYFAAFVFFSTVCSYNFHWALTPHSIAPSQRLEWDLKHQSYHLLLSVTGLVCSVIFFFFLKEHWFYIGIAAVLTFLYSAPKISFPPFPWLKKIAIGKTIFLAMTWTYVTAALPILTAGDIESETAILFCMGQFFFIYSICILFDFRDREDDKLEGIRSMITHFSERGIDLLFTSCMITFFILCFLLKQEGIRWINMIVLVIPAVLLIGLYKYAKRNFSDYLYYFVLDGLMMLPGLLLWMMNRF